VFLELTTQNKISDTVGPWAAWDDVAGDSSLSLPRSCPRRRDQQNMLKNIKADVYLSN
jgi:hypothetical protein